MILRSSKHIKHLWEYNDEVNLQAHSQKFVFNPTDPKKNFLSRKFCFELNKRFRRLFIFQSNTYLCASEIASYYLVFGLVTKNPLPEKIHERI